MLSITRDQMDALRRAQDARFRARLLMLLRAEEARLGPTPGRAAHAAAADPLAALMGEGLARAAGYGLPSEHDRALFVLRDQCLGPGWEARPEHRDAAAALRDPAVAPEDRIAHMRQREQRGHGGGAA